MDKCNNIKYLTNIDAEGVLLITRKENIFITDGRYIEVANSTVTIDDEIIVCNIILINNVVIVKNIPENLFLILSNGFESLSIILPIITTGWILFGNSPIIKSNKILKISSKIKYILKLY